MFDVHDFETMFEYSHWDNGRPALRNLLMLIKKDKGLARLARDGKGREYLQFLEKHAEGHHAWWPGIFSDHTHDFLYHPARHFDRIAGGRCKETCNWLRDAMLSAADHASKSFNPYEVLQAWLNEVDGELAAHLTAKALCQEAGVHA